MAIALYLDEDVDPLLAQVDVSPENDDRLKLE
jgi:hypothetical protein